MNLSTLTDTIGLGDLRCRECGASCSLVSVLTIGAAWAPAAGYREVAPFQFFLCDDCLEALRALIRKTRGRRPLSPRSRRGLSFLARNPAEHASYGDLAGAIGKYATNVILTLEERKLIERAGDHVRTSTYKLTPAGAAAVDSLELASK